MKWRFRLASSTMPCLYLAMPPRAAFIAAALFLAAGAPAGAETNSTSWVPSTAAQTASTVMDDELALATALFERADKDHDRRLSASEAAHLPAVAEKFQLLDRNADGFVSQAEYNALVGQR